jgi:hypothetical protein
VTLAWLVLGAIALWALVRLGRQTERRGRGEWRVAATLFGAVLLGAGALLLFRGAWLFGAACLLAGLWLAFQSRHRALPRSEPITEAEARQVLGVGPSATPSEIRAAWKRLMQRAHPDSGGSQGLAARLNAARDRLLRP